MKLIRVFYVCVRVVMGMAVHLHSGAVAVELIDG